MNTTSKFQIVIVALIISLAFSLNSLHAESKEMSPALSKLNHEIESHDTTFYKDFFDQVVYYPLSKPLRWDRIKWRLFGKREALDVNIYDEVPDSDFFINRHGKTLMTTDQLVKGPGTDGPSAEGPWTILKGKSEGVSAGFFIRDAKGVKFILKFDPAGNPEMATSTEVIGHKFFHAIGYNVPVYALAYFKPDILKIDPKATYYNDEGFKKPLDPEALEMLLKKLPLFKGGVYRASASKILYGIPKGFVPFEGTRKGDPEDTIPHENRRVIRALRVFASWLNHYDLRVGNSLDMLVEENGRTFLKHYIIDFGSLFGSAGSHIKYPAAVHENIIDWNAIGNALMIFKVENKDWEKRWDTNERHIEYPAIGYFDNLRFDAAKWHSQLSYEAFNRVTAADGYWAAKIISKFSNDMITALVKTGEISDPDAEQFLIKTLIDRRDMVVRYWFEQTVPVENVKIAKSSGNQYQLSFDDLSVQNHFESQEQIKYRYRIDKGPWSEFSGSSFLIETQPNQNPFAVTIAKAKSGSSSWTKSDLRLRFASGKNGDVELIGIERGC